MPRRPPLSESNFLAHVFSPRKQPLPTGLRKSILVGTKGRNKRRLSAFNRMSAFQQEVLKRSGQRDSYLRGDSTLADAKRLLRPKAIGLGVAKPVKSRHRGVPAHLIKTPLDALVARHVRAEVIAAGRPFNITTSVTEMQYLDAEDDMLTWTYGEIKHAGRRGSEYEVVVSGTAHNPFWYH